VARGLRIAAEVVLLVLGLLALGVVLRGMPSVAPPLAALLRGLFHPVTLVSLAAVALLCRAGRTRGARRGP